MTVEEMRAIMRRRVVPENLVVQNIVEYLMDDSAQLPQLNAFTFLNRLHELGMGSADFLTLLDGCGAPKAVVDKIKANPAMNLHNLVLTLENSGLTSDDYSDMLYTARLVWEQTQTSGGTVVPYFAGKSEETDVGKTESEIFDDNVEENSGEPISEEITSSEIAAVSPEKPDEETQTEDAHAEETASEESKIEGVSDEDSRGGEIRIEEIPAKKKSGKNPGTLLFLDDTDENAEESIEDDAEKDNSDGQKEKAVETPRENLNDTTTLIISLDPEKLKKEIGKSAEELDEKQGEESAQAPESPFDEDISENEESPDNEEPSRSSLDLSEEDSDDEDEDNEDDEDEDYSEDEEYDEYDDDEYDNSERLIASGYNKPALIISAVGAAILFLICAYFTMFGNFSSTVKKTVYAKDAEEIFMEIYESYTAGNIGDENAAEYFSGEKLFGTKLVSQKGFGVFTDGAFTYTVSEEKIIPHSGLDVNQTAGSEILPPENAKFVDFIQGEGFVAAIFSGTECGFIKLQKGETVFTVIQDGSLCDYFADENEISFGSVYVPRYTHTFNASDINEYCPRLGKNEKTPVAAENIALGNSSGCSFAVWGKYSLSDGNVMSAKAAVGNPVYAGADGICAMNFKDNDQNEFGRIIRLADEISSVKTDKITLGASENNISAFLTENQIIVLDENLEEKSVLQNFAQTPSGMKFEGNVLLLNGEDGIFSAVNCSDPTNPDVLETQKENGVVFGDKAVLFSTEGKIEVRLMSLENGEEKQTAVYEKQLSDEEMPTAELGGAEQTAVCGENCAFSYKYFDGVSVVSVCAVFGNETSETALYDDRTGYSAVFAFENKLIAVSSKGAEIVFE